MQCNSKSLGYFYLCFTRYGDFKPRSYMHLGNIPLLIYFVLKIVEGNTWRGRQEQFKLPVKAADEEAESASSVIGVNFLRQVAWLNLFNLQWIVSFWIN